MAMKIRLARGGSKKRPFYRIVAADSRMPRDGRYIERLGTYNPLLPKDAEDRVKMDMTRIRHWLDRGAKPTDRIARMLEAAGEKERVERSNPKKALPGEKAAKRAEEQAARRAAAEDAPKDEPAAESASEKPTAEEPSAGETPTEAATEEKAAEAASSESAGETPAAEEPSAGETPTEAATEEKAAEKSAGEQKAAG